MYMYRTAGLLLLLITGGCTSISSTMLFRNECNSGWNKIPKLKGVPITVKIPTHLKVYVYDTHLLKTDGEFVDAKFPIRDFATEFVYSEKIFTVDFKRPAAGAFNLDVDLTDDQYIEKIQHDVTDQTISEVGGLLDSIGGLPGFNLANDSGNGAQAPQITPVKSVAAVGLFEIDDPIFEEKVTDFINCHLNQAHDAWTVPSGTEINRTHLPDDQAGRIDPLCEGCPTPGQFTPLMPDSSSTMIEGTSNVIVEDYHLP